MFKFLTELSPVICFFFGYKIGGIFNATLYMLIASVFSISLSFLIERKLNKVNLISTALLLVSASLTLVSGDTVFIKIKPTILYILFATIFCVTSFKWKPAIQQVLGGAIKLRDEQKWKSLNIRFMWFFLLMAILNETIWRNFSEETWVSFKVFGAMPLVIIFVLIQMPFLLKNKIENEDVV